MKRDLQVLLIYLLMTGLLQLNIHLYYLVGSNYLRLTKQHLGFVQILANNSTLLHYWKITLYLAISRARILGRFGGYNSTRLIFESEL